MDRVLHLLGCCTNNQVPAEGTVIYGIPEDEGRDCQFAPPDDQPVFKKPHLPPPKVPLAGRRVHMDWLKSAAFLTDQQETSVLSSGAGMPISVPSAGKDHTLQQSQVV